MKSDMVVATFFDFLPTSRDEMHNMVKIDDDLPATRPPATVLVSLPVEICKTTEEIGVFSLLRESDFDAVYVFRFHRGREGSLVGRQQK